MALAISSTSVAEMVKLLENTFRSINIGLANEMALLCDHMGIDVWEVIEAAATKPFGFMPFYPGPGLGGHCIPVDPFYLSWKAKLAGTTAHFIELAGRINSSMPEYVVRKVQGALNDRTKSVKGSSIHLLGLAYKRNVSDTRESPALDLLLLLERLGARISYRDPYVSELELEGRTWQSQDALQSCATALRALRLAAPAVEEVVADLELFGDFGDRLAKAQQAEGLLLELGRITLIGFLGGHMRTVACWFGLGPEI